MREVFHSVVRSDLSFTTNTLALEDRFFCLTPPAELLPSCLTPSLERDRRATRHVLLPFLPSIDHCPPQRCETITDPQWFHGNLGGSKPQEVMTIPAGGSLRTEIACGKAYTSWGNQPSGDACPHDSGSYHAGGQTGSQSGWSGNSEENLSGCALAIAFKADASQVRPEDFTVMSVQENCVRQRDTNFEIPANLPACPDGECTCAWFWQGKNR